MKFSWVCGSTPLNNKVRFSVFVLIIAGIISGCTSHPEGPPGKDILRQKQFVEVLIDMHYYEGIYAIAGSMTDFMPGGAMASDSVDYYQPILDKHGIDREVFNKTVRYYSFDPVKFEALYNQVVEELNRRYLEIQMDDPLR